MEILKVLLMQPWIPKNRKKKSVILSGFLEPLGPIMLATCLEKALGKKVEIQIIDARIDRKSWRKKIKGFNPDLVGISAITITRNPTLEIAGFVQENCPQAKIIVGGHDPTMRPEKYKHREIDFIALGYATVQLIKIAEKLLADDNDFTGIKGIIFQNSQSTVQFIANQPMDAEKAIAAEMDVIPDRKWTGQYIKHYILDGRRHALVKTTYGCFGRCDFCSCHKFSCGAFLSRNPQTVAKEIAGIEEKWIYLADDESFANAKAALELWKLLKKLETGHFYQAYVRTDTVIKHPELMKLAYETGLRSVTTGYEALSNKELAALNKKNDVDTNEEAARILRDIGIENGAHFIMHPDFSKKDFEKIIRYVIKMEIRHPLFTVLTPLPGTDLWKRVNDDLVLNEDEFFDLAHMVLPLKHLDIRTFYGLIEKIFAQNYSLKRWMKFCLEGKAKIFDILVAYMIRNWLHKEFQKFEGKGGYYEQYEKALEKQTGT